MDPKWYRAAMEGKLDDLSQYGADQFALQVTPNGNTLLHVAAEFGSYHCVPAILSKCPSLLHRANTDGDTPIHVAAAQLKFDVVNSLLNFAKSEEGGGAAAVREMWRARNHDGNTPLHLAAMYDKWGSFLEKLFTEEDPGFDHGLNKAGETPLYLYVDRGYNVAVLSHMLKPCTPPEYGGPGGKTALHSAVIHPKHKFIDKLIEWKKDLIKEPDTDGRTPLHYAAQKGNVEAVKKLLDKDESVAYVTANNDEGNTALHMATAKGNTKVMKEILSKCPDCWEMVNSKGQNILHVSADLERDEATKYISKQPWVNGVVNRKDHEGNTPMHVLAHNYKGKLHSVLLFSRGADMKALNNEGKTPRDILLPKIRRKNWLQRKRFLTELDEKELPGKEKETQKAAEDTGKMADTHMIVATLIATISFAAGFTIPGGNHGDQDPNQGMAVLVREAAFKAFVITNAIAVVCSTSSVFLYVSASLFDIKGQERKSRAHRYAIAFGLTITAMLAMMVAFITGAYAVLAHSLGLAIVTCVIACSPFFVYAFDLKKHFAEDVAYFCRMCIYYLTSVVSAFVSKVARLIGRE